MTRLIIVLFFIPFFLCCSDRGSNQSVNIYIPLNYTGWVNIIFNDSSNNSIQPLSFNNGYVYLITKDPQFFKVKTNEFPAGKYDMNCYYYNTDTIIKLSWGGFPKTNVIFERTIGSSGYNKYRPSINTFSFYVSKEPLTVNGLSEEMLPKNKIFELGNHK
ncbi:hypothetical protein GO495_31485 [Chitinophaga oryziterrae]|uniref:Uncharacterized protein n=1 Tax=Chitinophaga oryziterrae TaxID=1031224 RepID=A0A6N8JIR4_9BACT|nr:hypothetical protein [Chitinophaga oryziterrae]MVT45153.1 hypothetical protein [Chitinophaga oryziterrae]